MVIEEIKEYLKRTAELERKLKGKDKETLQWIIHGYNECARLLNQRERATELVIKYISDKFRKNFEFDCGIAPQDDQYSLSNETIFELKQIEKILKNN